MAVLLYIYRPGKLKKDFAVKGTSELLEEYGYTVGEPGKCIVQLSKRLNESEEFPHEIGLFLGYPLEDVKGFIENSAEGYKCVGCWKVYGDEQDAKKSLNDIENAQMYIALNGQMEKALNSSQ